MENISLRDFYRRYPERMASVYSKTRECMADVLSALENDGRNNLSGSQLARLVIKSLDEIVKAWETECKDDEFAAALWPLIESSEVLQFVQAMSLAQVGVYSAETDSDNRAVAAMKTRRALHVSSEFLAQLMSSEEMLSQVFPAFLALNTRVVQERIRGLLNGGPASLFGNAN